MKQLFLLITLLTCQARLPAQSRSATFSGVVTDSVTSKPLVAASVYLNNTSRGTVTRADGSFALPVPDGSWQLVISAVGYSTTIIDINGSQPLTSLNIRLRESAEDLTAITVEPYEKNGWAKYGKFFRDNFIGAGPNAASCEISNRGSLHFYFYKRSNRLRVTATEPLHIENNALGYVLEYQLVEFICDFNTKIITWQGYPFFQEMTPKNKEKETDWVHNRKNTYRGSMLHFMRSLYAGHLLRESFLIQRDVVVPNWEKRRVKEIYRPEFQKPGLFSMDTLHYFWDVLREPDPIRRRTAVSDDSLIVARTPRTKTVYFDGTLLVTYGVNNRTDDFYQSAMKMLGAQPVTVEENGNYYPSREVHVTGFWGQSEKICNLLPLDYYPPPPDPRYPGLH
jgi:hypothetical protein